MDCTACIALREYAQSLNQELAASRRLVQSLQQEIQELASNSFKLAIIQSQCTSVRFGSSCAHTACGSSDVPGDGTSVAWDGSTKLPLPSYPETCQTRENYNWRWFPFWCPCCRRPIDVTLVRSHDVWEQIDSKQWYDIDQTASSSQEPFISDSQQQQAAVVGQQLHKRFAYVAALWGTGHGFVTGAIALGAGLRGSGTKHDLVLLHTDDIQQEAINVLSELWTLHKVSLLRGCRELFHRQNTRFDGVFTKIHAFSLTQYDKVLLLDLDIAVLACVDEVFSLHPPAAMFRRRWGWEHGRSIDGRSFFCGEYVDADSDCIEWGQGSGINAGVMLLKPDSHVYNRIYTELEMWHHPAHIAGSGPEQDYLSRMFAPWWKHLGVQYNFQLHRTFHALDAVLESINATGKIPDDLPDRLSLEDDDWKLIHFSGELKLWDTEDLFSDSFVKTMSERILRDSAGPDYCKLWLDRDAEQQEYERTWGVSLVNGMFVHNEFPDCDVEFIITRAVRLARCAAERAASSFQSALGSLDKSMLYQAGLIMHNGVCADT